MSILNKINAAATTGKANTDRGQVKTLIIALLSYCKHTNQTLTAKQVASLVREYIPTAKTTHGSVADYRHNLATGLFDYVSEAEATETLKQFEERAVYEGMTYGNLEETEETAVNSIVKPTAPWSANDIIYNRNAKRVRKAK